MIWNCGFIVIDLDWNGNFWDLTDDEILEGLSIMYDSKLLDDAITSKNKLSAFALDSHLQELAHLWITCDRDRTWMKLRL